VAATAVTEVAATTATHGAFTGAATRMRYSSGESGEEPKEDEDGDEPGDDTNMVAGMIALATAEGSEHSRSQL